METQVCLGLFDDGWLVVVKKSRLGRFGLRLVQGIMGRKNIESIFEDALVYKKMFGNKNVKCL